MSLMRKPMLRKVTSLYQKLHSSTVGGPLTVSILRMPGKANDDVAIQ